MDTEEWEKILVLFLKDFYVQNPIVRIVMKKKNRNQLKKENSMEVGLFGTEEGDEVSIITLECKL